MIVRWLILTLAVGITSYILPGVAVENVWVALVVAIVLGLVNVFLKPLMIILTLPLTIVTLGLFVFVINALLVMLTGMIVPGFTVASFWWALLFSLVLSIIDTLLGGKNARKEAHSEWAH